MPRIAVLWARLFSQHFTRTLNDHVTDYALCAKRVRWKQHLSVPGQIVATRSSGSVSLASVVSRADRFLPAADQSSAISLPESSRHFSPKSVRETASATGRVCRIETRCWKNSSRKA